MLTLSVPTPSETLDRRARAAPADLRYSSPASADLFLFLFKPCLCRPLFFCSSSVYADLSLSQALSMQTFLFYKLCLCRPFSVQALPLQTFLCSSPTAVDLSLFKLCLCRPFSFSSPASVDLSLFKLCLCRPFLDRQRVVKGHLMP